MLIKYYYNIYFDKDGDDLFIQICMNNQMEISKLKELILEEATRLYDTYEGYECQSELFWEAVTNICKNNGWVYDFCDDDEAERIEAECIKNKDFDVIIKDNDFEW